MLGIIATKFYNIVDDFEVHINVAVDGQGGDVACHIRNKICFSRKICLSDNKAQLPLLNLSFHCTLFKGHSSGRQGGRENFFEQKFILVEFVGFTAYCFWKNRPPSPRVLCLKFLESLQQPSKFLAASLEKKSRT